MDKRTGVIVQGENLGYTQIGEKISALEKRGYMLDPFASAWVRVVEFENGVRSRHSISMGFIKKNSLTDVLGQVDTHIDSQRMLHGKVKGVAPVVIWG